MEDVGTESLLIALSHPSYEGESLQVVVSELSNRFLELNQLLSSDTDANTLILPDSYSEAYKGIFFRLTHLNKLSNKTINCLLSLLVNTTNAENQPALRQGFADCVKRNYQTIFETCIDKFLDYYPQAESKSATDGDWSSVDPYQHMADILCNLSATAFGRQLILDSSKDYFKKLVVQVSF
jgi:hypothetical protein